MSVKTSRAKLGGKAADEPVSDEPVSDETVLIVEELDVSSDEIALRAYEIHVSGGGGDEVENWLRAEAELRAERRPGATADAGEGSRESP
jgi:hypothetical protein